MIPLAANSPTYENPVYWAIAMGVLTLLYTVFRPMFRRKDPLEKRVPFGGLAQQRSVERDMSNLLVELSEMARQVSAQLDTRAAKLELLIKEADQKIAALKTAAQDTPDHYPPLQTVPHEDPIDPRHAEIYSLADKGHSAYQIARQLNRPSGEVELILALRPKS